jgi:Protein of unknown function (DUF1279)
MASTMATIRGLTARNARLILLQPGDGGMRVLTRMAWRKGVNTIGGGAVRTFVENGSAGYYTSSFPGVAARRQAQRTYTHLRDWEIASSRILPMLRSRLFHTTRTRRSAFNPKITPNSGSSQEESLSLGQRMRKLSREYGWSALGVYLVLTALDLPFCYLFVGYLGTERIGKKDLFPICSIQAPLVVLKPLERHEDKRLLTTVTFPVSGKERKERGDKGLMKKPYLLRIRDAVNIVRTY